MTTFSCPGCGAPLVAGTPKCMSCGIRLVGELAGQLWLVDQELVALRARRAVLVTALRTEEQSPPQPSSPPERVSQPQPMSPATAVAAPVGVETRTVLLWLGAACLVAALVAGTALLWSALGATGQAVVMLVVTASLLTGAVRLRRLPATAEALAAVGVAAVGIDLIAGQSLGVPLLHHMSDRAYWSVGSLLAVLTLSAVAHARRELASPSVGAVVAAFAAVTALMWPTTVGGVALLGAIAVIGGVAMLRWSAMLAVHQPAVRSTAAAGAVVAAVVGLLAAAVAAAEQDAAALCGLVIAAVLALLPEILRTGWSTGSRRGCATGAGAIAGVLGLLADVGEWQGHLPAVAVGCVVVAAVLVLLPRREEWQDRVVFTVAATAGLAGVVAQLRLQKLAVEGIGLRPAGWSLLAVACLLAVVGLRAHQSVRPAWAAGASAVGLTAVAEIAAAGLDRTAAATVVAAVAGALALVALSPRRTGAALWIVTAGDVVATVATATTVVASLALADDLSQLAVVTVSLAGAAAVVVAIFPPSAAAQRLSAAVVASLYASVAAGAALKLHDVDVVEAYVAVPAVTWVLLGAWCMRRSVSVGSWVLAPGLLVGALPTLALALDGDVTRQICLLVAAAAAVAVGATWRLSAPMQIGVAVVVTVLLRVVAPHVIGLPRWMTLGSVGAALLILGATWERRVDDVRRFRADITPRIAALR